MLDALFPRRFHIGKAGDGGRAKLAVNLILGLNRMALAEGLTFAERMGLDPKAFLAVAQGSASQSQVMGTKGPKMLARDFVPEGRVKQTLKDVHMMLDQAEQLGQELPMLRGALRRAGVLRAGRRGRARQQHHRRGNPAPRAGQRALTLLSPPRLIAPES